MIKMPWPWLIALFVSGGAVECALSNWNGRPADVETLRLDVVVIGALFLGGLQTMINIRDARTLAAAWATALLHSAEGLLFRARVWLKDVLRAYEQRAIKRLYAGETTYALKALHARVEALEKRLYEPESEVAANARRLLAKVG